MCTQFRCAPLHIKKALEIFRELIPRRRTTTTTVAFGDPTSGSKSFQHKKLMKQTHPLLRLAVGLQIKTTKSNFIHLHLFHSSITACSETDANNIDAISAALLKQSTLGVSHNQQTEQLRAKHGNTFALAYTFMLIFPTDLLSQIFHLFSN